MHNIVDHLASYTELHPSGCWLWTGGRGPSGYGRAAAVRGFSVLVHRRAYQLAYGPIPEGLDVHHRCFVRHCVNPEHLAAVPHEHNTQERKGADRRSTTGVRGVSRRGDRYLATCKHRGRNYSGGRFDTIEEAAVAAEALRARVFATTRNEPR